MSSLLGALLDDRGANVSAAAINIIVRMLAAYGDSGATAVLTAALEAVAASTLAEEEARWGVTLEDLQMQETGILSLTEDDRRALMCVAAAWAADDPQRCRMLLADVAAICKRAATKDVLLAYLLPARAGATARAERRAAVGGDLDQRYLAFED